MSDLIKREDATAVISKTLGSLGNSVVTEINSLSGYATQDYARFTQDLISREDARKAIEKLMDIHFDRQVVLAKARDAIVSLPSAEPPYQYSTAYVEQIRGERDILQDMVDNMAKRADRPTGEWVRLEREENVYDLHGVPTWGINYMCDKCGFITTAIQDHFGQYKFCPNCGAKMEGGEDK